MRSRLADILKLKHVKDPEPDEASAHHSHVYGQSIFAVKSLQGHFGGHDNSPSVTLTHARLASSGHGYVHGGSPGEISAELDDQTIKRNQAEQDRLAATRERAREKAMRAAQREERETNSMVEALHKSAEVKSRRFRFAMRTLLTEIFWFLSLVIVFALFTPTAPDYNASAIASFTTALQQDLSSLTSTIQDGVSWQQFVDYNILWTRPESSSNDSTLISTISGQRRLDSRTRARLGDRKRQSDAPGSMQDAPLLFEEGDKGDVDFVQQNRFLRRERGMVPLLFASSTQSVTTESSQATDTTPGVDQPARERALTNNESTTILPDGLVFMNGVTPDVVSWDDPSTKASGFQAVELSPGIAPMMLMSNIVVGSLRIRRTSIPVERCRSASNVKGGPEYCRGAEVYTVSTNYVQNPSPPVVNYEPMQQSNDAGDVVVDLDSANVAQRRTVSNTHRTGSAAWITEGTNSLSIDFTVYNPPLAVFSAIRIFTYFPSFGGSQTVVIVRAARIYESRFQPSVIFEIVIGVLVALQLLQIYSSSVRANGWRKWIRSGWNIFEFVTCFMFGAVLAFDVYNLIQAESLHVDLQKSGKFFDIWYICGLIRDEIDLTSALYYLLVVRAVRYARLIPGWGPILMAIISTLTDGAVVLYLAVLLVLIFAIGISQFVAFSAENVFFPSILVSFESLYTMMFAQQYSIYTPSTPRFSSTIYYILWSLLSVVFMNLLIGIVTDVYQNKASGQSVKQWERHITLLMELSAVERRRAAVRKSVSDWLQ